MKKIITSALLVAGLAMSAQTMAQDEAAGAVAPAKSLSVFLEAATTSAKTGNNEDTFLGFGMDFSDKFSGQLGLNYDNDKTDAQKFDWFVRGIMSFSKGTDLKATLTYMNASTTTKGFSAGLQYSPAKADWFTIGTDFLHYQTAGTVKDQFKFSAFDNVRFDVAIPVSKG